MSYKFKELKVYSSTEWLAGSAKKYRQVFDSKELAYVYAELSLYNKLFDNKSWEAEITLTCFQLGHKPTKVCDLRFTKTISKFDHIINIREGWGNKNIGSFWKVGTYFWEAYISGKKLATKYFYVEDYHSNLSANKIPFDIKSIELHEGIFDDIEDKESNSLIEFNAKETRYIFAILKIENFVEQRIWHLELIFKFFNQAKELKGTVTKLIKVKPGDDFIEISAGWGSNTPGSWKKGEYNLEIIFNNNSICSTQFSIDEKFVEGEIELASVNDQNNQSELDHNIDENLTFEEVFEKLDNLVGLTQIKTEIKNHSKYLEFLRLRTQRGLESTELVNIHSVFIGNPGTGKTTVAKMLGLIYKKMGLLSKGHVVEVDRVDLVGEYIGQTAPKVKEVIKKARGGVLFIDEAYSLARANDDGKDFGREVIEILIKEMSNGEGDMSIIVAGYPKEMEHFINSNPGLNSRFKQFFEFSDYLPSELVKIAEYACNEKGVKLSTAALNEVNKLIVESYRSRNRSFGNARHVYDLIEKLKINMGLRIMSLNNVDSIENETLSLIELADVIQLRIKTKIKKAYIPIDEDLLNETLNSLNNLIGLKNIKKEILELIQIIKYYRQNNMDVLDKIHMHTILSGNPGTGKTTIARLLAKIFKALGLLERGHIVETDRQGLVSGYVGQTAIKTADKIDEAIGGVLFIDEAYSLSSSNGVSNDFGGESIQTILKRMEDKRGEFFVFAAGYPRNMERFLSSNPGLSSRFDKILNFEDYTLDELFEIAIKIGRDHGYTYNVGAQNTLKENISQLLDKKNKFFGNARTIRKIVFEIIKAQNLRISSEVDPNEENKSQIIELDVLNYKTNVDGIKRNHSIGFRKK